MQIQPHQTLAAQAIRRERPRPRPWPAPDDPDHPLAPTQPEQPEQPRDRPRPGAAIRDAITLSGGLPWMTLRAVMLVALATASLSDPSLLVLPPAVTQ